MLNFFKKKKELKIHRTAIYNKHIRIYFLSLNEFMNYNPPCNECLIQTMCLNKYPQRGYDNRKIITRIEYCKELELFVRESKNFHNLLGKNHNGNYQKGNTNGR